MLQTLSFCRAGACAIAAVCALASAQAAADPSPIPFTYVVVDSAAPRDLHVKTVGDIDGDGFDDILAGSSAASDGLFWYRYPSWSKHTIVPPLVYAFSTDIQVADVDRDGDLDVVVPRRNLPRTVWWYENPRPGGDPGLASWTPHFIGDGSAHDLEVGDIDNDGRIDVVAREDTTRVFFQDGAGGWTATVISTRPSEGVSLGDLDRDGDADIAINGYWLENPLPASDPDLAPWIEHTIDPGRPARVGVLVGDVNGDGRADVTMAPSESAGGRLSWYDAPAGPTGAWVETVIDADVSYLHTFKGADMDLDGDFDLVTAEMAQSADPDEVSIYLNQGGGLSWTQGVVATTGSHNLRITDIDLDGDIDIVGANWQGSNPLEMWRNDLDPRLTLDAWQRHVIDADRPWRAVFVDLADLDRDGRRDVVTGGWWYRNPGSAAGAWTRSTIAAPLANMAAVFDVDRDGDLDVLGTRGQGATSNDSLVWARNDGATAPAFSLLDNIEIADGDFLQGVAVSRFDRGEPARTSAMLSWHDTTTSLQRVVVPGSASVDVWPWASVSPLSQSEALSAGDVDRDGDVDLLLGTRWLRNDSLAWTPFDVTAVAGTPDRNVLADIDRDGRLDAVVGYEAVSAPGVLAWYRQGPVATDPWTEQVIAVVTGPMSLDVVDMDSDGDLDVVVGEHDLAAPATASLFVFENSDGNGGAWIPHTVYTGDEHHDGARAADLDFDGDVDIVSIGWGHDRVLLYENLALQPGGGGYLNDPPVAQLVADPTVGPAPLEVSLDASTSFDPDGDPISIVWDFGDGSPPDSNAVTSHTYSQDGAWDARVTVSDGLLADVATVSILVGNPPGPNEGLVHHWRFDEGTGTSAGDSVGDAHGTLSGAVSWGDGRSGSALSVDGAGGRVEVDADAATDEITLALWFRADDFGVPDGRFITRATGTANDDHLWMLSTIDETALRFRLRTKGTTDVLATATGVISAGTWTHVAATYDGKHMRIYRDGVELTSLHKNGSIDGDSTVAAAIGNQPAGAGDLAFDGLIDDVRIYDRALSAAEIDSLVQYRLSISVAGNGSVSRDPTGISYMDGEVVVLTAVPQPGWAFSAWSGGLSGGQNPDTVVIAGDTSVTATFVSMGEIPTVGTVAMAALLLVLLALGGVVLRTRPAS